MKLVKVSGYLSTALGRGRLHNVFKKCVFTSSFISYLSKSTKIKKEYIEEALFNMLEPGDYIEFSCEYSKCLELLLFDQKKGEVFDRFKVLPGNHEDPSVLKLNPNGAFLAFSHQNGYCDIRVVSSRSNHDDLFIKRLNSVTYTEDFLDSKGEIKREKYFEYLLKSHMFTYLLWLDTLKGIPFINVDKDCHTEEVVSRIYEAAAKNKYLKKLDDDCMILAVQKDWSSLDEYVRHAG